MLFLQFELQTSVSSSPWATLCMYLVPSYLRLQVSWINFCYTTQSSDSKKHLVSQTIFFFYDHQSLNSKQKSIKTTYHSFLLFAVLVHHQEFRNSVIMSFFACTFLSGFTRDQASLILEPWPVLLKISWYFVIDVVIYTGTDFILYSELNKWNEMKWNHQNIIFTTAEALWHYFWNYMYSMIHIKGPPLNELWILFQYEWWHVHNYVLHVFYKRN